MALDPRRAQIVQEAYSWLRTPYHHHAHIKGAGVDCVWLLIETYRPVGVVAADYDPGHYEPDWFLHRSEELYLGGVLKHAKQVEKPEVGDVALFTVGRCVAHGVIIVDTEPELLGIHASRIARNVELVELRALETDRAHLHSYWSPFA